MYTTNYFENMILNTHRGQTAVAPAALYVGLFYGNPGETGGAATETAYNGYLRQRIIFGAPYALNGGIGVVNNGSSIFPAVPTTTLPDITHLGVFDAPVGGNMLIYGEFTEPVKLQVNDIPVIVAGEAQWWYNGTATTYWKTKVLNLLRGASISGFIPYIALYGGNPDSGGAELSGENYGRVPVLFAAPTQEENGQARIANSQVATSARASTGWGVWNYTVICEGPTGANGTFYQQRQAKEVLEGLLYIAHVGTITLGIS